VQDEAEDLPYTDFDSFVNYQGVELDPEIFGVIEGYRDAGYLMEFDSLRDCEKYLGGRPILSKFGCVTRERVDYTTGETHVKRRIIMDSKQSEESRTSRAWPSARCCREPPMRSSALWSSSATRGRASLSLGSSPTSQKRSG
jgi:hypothetical protein